MMQTKHIIIETDNSCDFEDSLNKASQEYNVFATQTHIKLINNIVVYFAVIFYKEVGK